MNSDFKTSKSPPATAGALLQLQGDLSDMEVSELVGAEPEPAQL